MLKLSLTLDSVVTHPSLASPRKVASSGSKGFADSLRGAVSQRSEKATQTDRKDDDRQHQAQGSAEKAQALPDRPRAQQQDVDDKVSVDQQDATPVSDVPIESNVDVEPDDDVIDADQRPADDADDADSNQSAADDVQEAVAVVAVPQQIDITNGAAKPDDASHTPPRKPKFQQAGSEQTASKHSEPKQAPPVHVEDQRRDAAQQQAQLGQPSQPSQQHISAQQPEPEPVQPSNDKAHLQPRDAAPADAPMPAGERVDAAVARAVQVETAIRLENATAQPASSDASSRPATMAIQGGAAISGNGVHHGSEQAGQFNAQPMVDEERFSSRIVRGLTAMVNQRGGAMTMRLDPPELGQLRVQMTIARGVVNASFVASTSQTHALLDKNLATLRVALESQGLTVDRLSVQLSQPGIGQNHSMYGDQKDQQDRQHQHHDAGGGQSRGRRDERENDPQHPTNRFAGVVAQMNEFAGESTGVEP